MTSIESTKEITTQASPSKLRPGRKVTLTPEERKKRANARCREWIDNNKEKMAQYAREAYHRRKNDPDFKEQLRQKYLKRQEKMKNKETPSQKIKRLEEELDKLKTLVGNKQEVN